MPMSVISEFRERKSSGFFALEGVYLNSHVLEISVVDQLSTLGIG